MIIGIRCRFAWRLPIETRERQVGPRFGVELSVLSLKESSLRGGFHLFVEEPANSHANGHDFFLRQRILALSFPKLVAQNLDSELGRVLVPHFGPTFNFNSRFPIGLFAIHHDGSHDVWDFIVFDVGRKLSLFFTVEQDKSHLGRRLIRVGHHCPLDGFRTTGAL